MFPLHPPSGAAPAAATPEQQQHGGSPGAALLSVRSAEMWGSGLGGWSCPSSAPSPVRLQEAEHHPGTMGLLPGALHQP